MKKRTVRDLDVRGRRALVRVDFNVPLDDQGRVTNDLRIREALPTLRFILERGGKLVLMSHLGRPKGQVVESMRLKPSAERLQELLGRPVRAVRDCVGPEVERASAALGEGGLMMLENLRFHPEEEKNDAGFARALARNGDAFVNDAFGSSHRAHASVAGVAKLLPSAAGFLMEKELENLGGLLGEPERPFAAVLGGAKVSDKLVVLGNLAPRLDALLIGGGMAYTFLKARGEPVGASKVEEDRVEAARKIMADCAAKGVKLLLPVDHVVATRFAADAPARVVERIGEGEMGLDIGPRSCDLFAEELGRCRTILWNGPVGVFEWEAYRNGTKRVGEAIARSGGRTVVGGGDSAAAELLGIADRFTHVSTGGGASLELLEGKELPGVAALPDAGR